MSKSSSKEAETLSTASKFLEINSIEIPSSVELANIQIIGCESKVKGSFDKKDVCFYCGKTFTSTSFMRHMSSLHPLEDDVKELNECLKGSNKRRRCAQLLRNKGNFKHNLKVLKEGGDLIVAQRPKHTINVSNTLHTFVVCPSCLGFYSRHESWRHACPAEKTERRKHVSVTHLTTSMSEEVKYFFARLRRDDVGNIARHDKLIWKYITRMVLKKGFDNYRVISEKVRIMCLFMQKYREKIEKMDCNFSEMLHPMNIELIRETIVDLFQYESSKTPHSQSITMEKPSSLKRLGQALKKLARVLQTEHLKTCSFEAAKEAKVMMSLIDEEIGPLMTNAKRTMSSSQSGKPQPLPSADEIKTLKDYMRREISTTERNESNLKKLKELTLTYLILFNKRRSSEVAKLTKLVWNERQVYKKDALEEMDKLSDKEKNIVNSIDLVYMRGKCGRFVPVIFPQKIVPLVDWLSKQTNNFIFENTAETPMRGNDAIRNVSKSAGVDSKNINSTKFRKRAATTLQVSSTITHIYLKKFS